jgi:hypothetical protein
MPEFAILESGEGFPLWEVATMPRGGLAVHRIDVDTVELRSLDGPLFRTPYERHFLRGEPPLRAVRGPFEFTRDPARPDRIELRVDPRADRARIRFFDDGPRGLREVALPPVGADAILR